MTSNTEQTLAEQRLALRTKLLTQRQLIEHKLGPLTEATGGYPRSMTMRFVTRQPALVAKLLVGVATLFLGVRIYGSITVAFSVARIVRSTYIASTGRKNKNEPL